MFLKGRRGHHHQDAQDDAENVREYNTTPMRAENKRINSCNPTLYPWP